MVYLYDLLQRQKTCSNVQAFYTYNYTYNAFLQMNEGNMVKKKCKAAYTESIENVHRVEWEHI